MAYWLALFLSAATAWATQPQYLPHQVLAMTIVHARPVWEARNREAPLPPALLALSRLNPHYEKDQVKFSVLASVLQRNPEPTEFSPEAELDLRKQEMIIAAVEQVIPEAEGFVRIEIERFRNKDVSGLALASSMDKLRSWQPYLEASPIRAEFMQVLTQMDMELAELKRRNEANADRLLKEIGEELLAGLAASSKPPEAPTRDLEKMGTEGVSGKLILNYQSLPDVDEKLARSQAPLGPYSRWRNTARG